MFSTSKVIFFPKSRFNYLYLALLGYLEINYTQAALVRGDINYQYYRDFAENKGQFAVGASNIAIYNKNNDQIGTMLPNVPMPDFSVINSNGGVATLVGNPQYITSVAHNGGYRGVQFGAIAANHPDNHTFTYNLIHNNNYQRNTDNPYPHDYQYPRLQKLVTEVAPIEPVSAVEIWQYVNRNRYPVILRVGSGTQAAMVNGKKQSIAGAYQFLTGGNTPRPETGWFTNKAIFPVFDTNIWTDRVNTMYGPMTMVGLGGDSGSGVFIYDNQEKKWLYLATMQSVFSSERGNNLYIAREQYHNTIIDSNIAATIDNTQTNEQWTWRHTATIGEHSLSSSNKSYIIDVFNPTLANPSGQINPRFNHGKTVIFSGEKGRLHFAGNIHQGAGALIFESDFEVTGNDNITWQGAGIEVKGNKTVTWKVANPKGDRLSKIGAGTLHVNGVGINPGDISIGDGTVILDQQADTSGNRQAFNQLGIVSGRATVIINSPDQMDWNNLYFGFRGGRLDVNGVDIALRRIKNVDDGAQIVNHNLNQPASITLTGNTAFTEQDIQWGKWKENGRDIYEYTNNYHNNRKDYFFLKGQANTYFPTNQTSNAHWEYIGSGEEGREKAIAETIKRKNELNQYSTFNGYLGEQEGKPNGELNIFYQPSVAGNTLLLTGGSNLNGVIETTDGNIVFSGRPVAHAYDYINKQEVIFDNEWINRQFTAKAYHAKGHGQLIFGRNINELKGNITAKDQAKIHLGYSNNTPICERSDYTGITLCNIKNYTNDIIDTMPRLQYQGNINLHNTTQLTVGKTQLLGQITASPESQIYLSSRSHWTLTNDSTVGYLNLDKGSQIHLSTANNPYHTLTIQGDLSGKGDIYYRTNIAEQLGDKIIVSGNSTGEFNLFVQNTGVEPKNKSKYSLTLIQLNPEKNNQHLQLTLNNGYVDLGAYRYVLTQNANEMYYLWNAKMAEEFEEEKRQVEELAHQEALKRQEEELARKEALKRQAEEQARQAELKRQAEELARQEELKRQAEELARQEELKRQAEELARQEELKQQAEELARQEELKQQAEELARQKFAQSQIISQYTNTALSEYSSHVHTLNNINQNIFRYIHNSSILGLFINQTYHQADHQSDYYRNYRKNEQISQFGLTKNINNRLGTLTLASIYSYATSHNHFDDNIHNKGKTNGIAIYAKQNFNNDTFIAINIGQTRSTNKIYLDNIIKVKRITNTIGINIGKAINTPIIKIRGAIGGYYHFLNGLNYQLSGANITMNNEQLFTYYTNIKFEKIFSIGHQLNLTPYILTEYMRNTQNSYMMVNNHYFSQSFNNLLTIGAGLSIDYKKSYFRLQIDQSRGKEIKGKNELQAYFQYRW